ncbi:MULTISPECIES: hypothetical protein [Bacillaceae]|uniref:hypothetical protein n=1 Tax=Bacillaceae TaxID=186817 RepID=UPI0012DE3342|nr:MULTISPECIES: hypothetical protein [Bacillaceae]
MELSTSILFYALLDNGFITILDFYAVLYSIRNLSATIAMNPLFVGFAWSSVYELKA